jgi:hypothetical protein
MRCGRNPQTKKSLLPRHKRGQGTAPRMVLHDRFLRSQRGDDKHGAFFEEADCDVRSLAASVRR